MQNRLLGAGLVAALVVLGAVPFPALAPLLPQLKALPAFFWALACFMGPPRGRLWGTTALILASLADYLMARDPASLAGIALFLSVQLVYSVRFWSLTLARPRAWAPALGFGALYGSVFVLSFVLAWKGLGPLALPYLVYGALLTLMAIGAGASGAGLLVLLGGMIFFFSDTIIVVRQFETWTQPWWDWSVLVPYYAGQGLLAAGLLRLQSASPEVAADPDPALRPRATPGTD